MVHRSLYTVPRRHTHGRDEPTIGRSESLSCQNEVRGKGRREKIVPMPGLYGLGSAAYRYPDLPWPVRPGS